MAASDLQPWLNEQEVAGNVAGDDSNDSRTDATEPDGARDRSEERHKRKRVAQPPIEDVAQQHSCRHQNQCQRVRAKRTSKGMCPGDERICLNLRHFERLRLTMLA